MEAGSRAWDLPPTSLSLRLSALRSKRAPPTRSQERGNGCDLAGLQDTGEHMATFGPPTGPVTRCDRAHMLSARTRLCVTTAVPTACPRRRFLRTRAAQTRVCGTETMAFLPQEESARAGTPELRQPEREPHPSSAPSGPCSLPRTLGGTFSSPEDGAPLPGASRGVSGGTGV